MSIVWTLIAVLCVLAVIAAAWRFFALRSRGTAVVVRPLPSRDARQWRHGVLLYNEAEAQLFKLLSLAPWPDFLMERHNTEIINRRPVNDKEQGMLEADLRILEMRSGNQTFEVAVDAGGDTALVAWIESGPSPRRVR